MGSVDEVDVPCIRKQAGVDESDFRPVFMAIAAVPGLVILLPLQEAMSYEPWWINVGQRLPGGPATWRHLTVAGRHHFLLDKQILLT